jgi:hypothetical protein
MSFRKTSEPGDSVSRLYLREQCLTEKQVMMNGSVMNAKSMSQVSSFVEQDDQREQPEKSIRRS